MRGTITENNHDVSSLSNYAEPRGDAVEAYTALRDAQDVRDVQIHSIGIGLNAADAQFFIELGDNTGGAQNVTNANQLDIALQEATNVTFASDPGVDLVDGGAGNDVIFGDSGVSGLEAKIQAALGDDAPDVVTDLDVIEYALRFPDRVADWVEENNADSTDVLIGNEGNDVIYAQGGDDILFGDTDLSAMRTFVGDAELTVENVQTALTDLSSSALEAQLNNWEKTSDGDDWLFGQDGDDMLFGLGGDDKLKGGDGDDTLYGGSGDDALYGGSGSDKLYGGVGSDYLDGGDDAKADTVNGGAGTDIIRYRANDNIDGGDDAFDSGSIDILLGNSGDGSLADLLNVGNVEVFIKASEGTDIDSLGLVDLSMLKTVANLYVSDDEDEISLSNQEGTPSNLGWQLDSVVVTGDITMITYNGDNFTLTLETTLQAEVDQTANEIVLSTID